MMFNGYCEKCLIKPQKGIHIGNYNGIWLCGKCMVEAIKKVEERTRQIVLTE